MRVGKRARSVYANVNLIISWRPAGSGGGFIGVRLNVSGGGCNGCGGSCYVGTRSGAATIVALVTVAAACVGTFTASEWRLDEVGAALAVVEGGGGNVAFFGRAADGAGMGCVEAVAPTVMPSGGIRDRGRRPDSASGRVGVASADGLTAGIGDGGGSEALLVCAVEVRGEFS